MIQKDFFITLGANSIRHRHGPQADELEAPFLILALSPFFLQPGIDEEQASRSFIFRTCLR
jgi:hypothetical protein